MRIARERTGSHLPMLGRDPEFARALELLGESSWLTITGPPGIGKSRLAIEIGRHLAAKDEWVFFVDLRAAVPTSVVRITLEALQNTRGAKEQDENTLLHVLQTQTRPVIIFDQVDAVITQLGAVLGNTIVRTQARVLVASRTTLDSSAENVLRLRPLAMESSGPTEQLIRRRAANLDFSLDHEHDLSALVAASGGNPLVAELVAHAASVVGLEHATSLIETSTTIDALVAAVAGSLTLLDSQTRIALIAASVFPDGFDADDLQATLASDAPMLPLIASLVRSSLVYPTENRDFSVYPIVSDVVQRLFASERSEYRERMQEATLSIAERHEHESIDQHLFRLRRLRVRLQHVVDCERANADRFERAVRALTAVTIEFGGRKELRNGIENWLATGRMLARDTWLSFGEVVAIDSDFARLAQLIEQLEAIAEDQPLAFSRITFLRAVATMPTRDLPQVARLAQRGLTVAGQIVNPVLRAFMQAKMASWWAQALYFTGDIDTYSHVTERAVEYAVGAGSASEEIVALFCRMISPIGRREHELALRLSVRAATLSNTLGASENRLQALRHMLFAQCFAGAPDVAVWNEVQRLVQTLPNFSAPEATFVLQYATTGILVFGSERRNRSLKAFLLDLSNDIFANKTRLAHHWCAATLGFNMVGLAVEAQQCFDAAQASVPPQSGQSYSELQARAMIAVTSELLRGDTPRLARLEPFHGHYLTTIFQELVRLHDACAKGAYAIARDGTWIEVAEKHTSLRGKRVLQAIVAILAQGSADPMVTYAELIRLLWNEPRDTKTLRARVRAGVANLRKLGLPIESLPNGYRLSSSVEIVDVP